MQGLPFVFRTFCSWFQLIWKCLLVSRGFWNVCCSQRRIQGGDWGDRPPKTNESYFIFHDFAQFGKQYSQYNSENTIRNKTLLPNITEIASPNPTVRFRPWLILSWYAQELDKIHALYMRASFVDQLRESRQSLYSASIERVLVYIRSG